MNAAIFMVCAMLTVVDGDTIKCDGRSLRPMGSGAPDISGFDTPEPSGRSKCLAEEMLADLATQRMTELLKTPGLKIEDSGKIDRFDRPLVWLRLPDGGTVGERLIEEGYAKEWLPDRKVHWCE